MGGSIEKTRYIMTTESVGNVPDLNFELSDVCPQDFAYQEAKSACFGLLITSLSRLVPVHGDSHACSIHSSRTYTLQVAKRFLEIMDFVTLCGPRKNIN